MKNCPNCHAEVPAIANLCKHCMHDFNVQAPKKSNPLWTILFLALATAMVSAMVFAHIYGQQKDTHITVDRETKSIVFTTKYPDRTDVDRVFWKDISSVEYLKNTQPLPFQVWVVTNNGDRFEYTESREMLDVDAQRLADMIGKTVVIKDEYKGGSREGSP